MLRYLLCFAVAFVLFMLFTRPTAEQDEVAYRRYQAAYETALHSSSRTVSGVNFYLKKISRRGPPLIFYYMPDGSKSWITCVRCNIEGGQTGTQIGAVDFVMLPDGRKLAVELRSKTGTSLIDRPAMLQQLRDAMTASRNYLVEPSARQKRSNRRMSFAVIVGLMAVLTYASIRWKQRAWARTSAITDFTASE